MRQYHIRNLTTKEYLKSEHINLQGAFSYHHRHSHQPIIWVEEIEESATFSKKEARDARYYLGLMNTPERIDEDSIIIEKSKD